MCWMVAIPMAIAAAGSLMGSSQQNKAAAAQNDAMRKQSLEMVKQMNLQNADDRLKAQSALEDASNELTARNMQSVQAMGTLRAAIGESMLGGASMDRVSRVTEGQYIREANSVTDAYTRDYASIFAGQVGRTESTKGQIDANNRGEVKMKSGLSTVLEAGMAVGGAWASSSASGGLLSKSGGSKAPISAAVGTKTGR